MKTIYKINLLLLLAFTIINTACRREKKIVNISVPSVEINPANDNLMVWDSLVSEVEFIKLQSDKISSFGNLYKGYVSNGNIYIFDRRLKIFNVFDQDGKLVKSFKKGRGPNELNDMRDFSLKDGKIYILDYGKILCFAESNFNFISAWKIPNIKGMNPDNIAVFSKNNYLLWNSSPDLLDKSKEKYFYLYRIVNNKLKEEFLPFEFSSNSDVRFYKQPGTNDFLLRPLKWDYKVYKISENSITSYFEFDFKNKMIKDHEKLEELLLKRDNSFMRSEYFKYIENIYLYKNYIIFNCIGDKSYSYQGIINSDNFKILKFGRYNVRTPRLFFADTDYIYGYIEPYRLLENKDDKLVNIFTIKASDFLQDLKIEDNPVIVKFRLKNYEK